MMRSIKLDNGTVTSTDDVVSHDSFDTGETKAGYPLLVKPHEEGRLNVAYTNISTNEEVIELNPKVPYIWIYTEDKQVLIGIEHAEDYPEAFGDFAGKNELFARLKREKAALAEGDSAKKEKKERKEKQTTRELKEDKKGAVADTSKFGLGHTTLTTTFDKTTGVPAPQKAYIAGELVFSTKKNAWQLNNRSGRYHIVFGNDPQKCATYLGMVADEIERCLRVKPQIKVIVRSPAALWNKSFRTDKEPDAIPVARAINLLMKVFKYILPDSKQSKQYKVIKNDLLNENAVRTTLCITQGELTMNNVIEYSVSAHFRSSVATIISSIGGMGERNIHMLAAVEAKLEESIVFLKSAPLEAPVMCQSGDVTDEAECPGADTGSIIESHRRRMDSGA